MKTIEKSITIDAPAKTVFDYVTKPQNLPAWVPSMLSVDNVKGSGKGRTHQWSYRMAGVKLEGKSEVTAFDPPNEYQMKSSGGVRSTWTYRIQPEGDGCRFDLKVEYEIPTPVIGRIAERLLLKRNEREAKLGLENVKDICEHAAAAVAG